MLAEKNSRPLVLVSGYYGFSNLGDEAILEELTNELKELIQENHIVVLSNNPEETKKTFGVEATSRWNLLTLISLLPRARLFVSGGGGLFQDSTGIKSIVFYGGQILLARLFQTPVHIYAQGLGPIRTKLAQCMARVAIAQATSASVRDNESYALLQRWKLKASLTADPVWCLSSTEIPKSAAEQIAELKSSGNMTVGLSLRATPNFTKYHLQSLLTVIDQSLPKQATVLLLPLKHDQDTELLSQFMNEWHSRGRIAEILTTAQIERPSQWLAVLAQLDLLIGMRLHAIIMALKCGVPVVGLAYDPKVRHVLMQFGQPILNLTKENESSGALTEWLPEVKKAIANRPELSRRALESAAAAKTLACQNFQMLAKIL